MKNIYEEHLSESGRGDLGRKRDQRLTLDGGLSRKKKKMITQILNLQHQWMETPKQIYPTRMCHCRKPDQEKGLLQIELQIVTTSEPWPNPGR